jgi:hypothetical protein
MWQSQPLPHNVARQRQNEAASQLGVQHDRFGLLQARADTIVWASADWLAGTQVSCTNLKAAAKDGLAASSIATSKVAALQVYAGRQSNQCFHHVLALPKGVTANALKIGRETGSTTIS